MINNTGFYRHEKDPSHFTFLSLYTALDPRVVIGRLCRSDPALRKLLWDT